MSLFLFWASVRWKVFAVFFLLRLACLPALHTVSCETTIPFSFSFSATKRVDMLGFEDSMRQILRLVDESRPRGPGFFFSIGVLGLSKSREIVLALTFSRLPASLCVIPPATSRFATSDLALDLAMVVLVFCHVFLSFLLDIYFVTPLILTT